MSVVFFPGFLMGICYKREEKTYEGWGQNGDKTKKVQSVF